MGVLERTMNKIHGASSGGSRSPEYLAWMNMRARVRNPNHPKFPSYGGRGIKVCSAWESFSTFLADVGNRPSPLHSLDRIDNDGDYEPGNVRWATRSEQQRNTRRTKLTDDDVTRIRSTTETGVALARELGVNRRTIDRIRTGEYRRD